MVDWALIGEGILLLANWKIPAVMFAGMLLGLIFGVIPGVSGALGIAVLLPITFLMDPLTALVLLTSVYTGGLTGGGITAVLINTPGTPGAVATTFDGYPMTRKGQQNEALGLQVASSVVGGICGYVFLLFFINLMVKVALQFGPSEMVFLTIFMLIVIGTMGEQSLSRSVMAGLFGLLVGTVGTSEVTGVFRGTFGFFELADGFPVICLIGMFAISELLEIITRDTIIDTDKKGQNDFKRLLKGVRMTFNSPKTLARSALLGVGIGVLPGIGSTLASLMSYARAKNTAKPGQKFGEGEPEGIISAETANNASEGGAMSILLALGIPGSGATAILAAAFMLNGLIPGPRLMKTHGALIYGLISANLLQMLLLIFLATVVAFYISKIIYIPTKVLVPSLMITMAISGYAARNSFFDVFLFFIFGLIGWLMRRTDFSLVSFMIGLIMGRQLDLEIYRYVAMFGDDLTVFLKRPITTGLLILIVLTLGLNIYRTIRARKHLKAVPLVKE
jgi:putative tricarboxylic transport membrane protein